MTLTTNPLPAGQMQLQPYAMDKWDRRFFDLCALLASWSEDRGRRVGAVIVGDGYEVLSTGYNGLPRGINVDVESRHSREHGEKYHWFEHAERNAIFNAARIGVPLAGKRMYSSLFPCADCARAIIQCGILELRTFPELEQPDGHFSRSHQVSLEMLFEAGVKVYTFQR